jgi:hypothetical protein
MASALPSNALYNVQNYLRQKRATGAQVTPQAERAAWSGYFDTMENNSIAERNAAMTQERLDLIRSDQAQKYKLLEDEQKAKESAATWSGVGQGISILGQGGMLLKGTSLGSKVGLGPSAAATASPTATAATTATAAAPVTATGASAFNTAAAPTSSAEWMAASGGPTAATDATVGAGEGATVGAEAAGAGVGALSPYLGPAGVGFMTGEYLPNILGIKNKTAQVAVGAGAGAVTGAVTGAVIGGEAGLAAGSVIAPGYGTVIGGIIGLVAGGIGAKMGNK